MHKDFVQDLIDSNYQNTANWILRDDLIEPEYLEGSEAESPGTYVWISDESRDYFTDDPVGQSLDAHFDIVGMLDEYEEAEQDEALATPPDVITGEEPDIKEENYEKTQ